MSKMSKSSPRLVLNTLAATAAMATMVGMTGCSEQPEEAKVEAGAYQTVAQCMADGNPSNLCSEAQSVAEKAAPEVTYEAQSDCTADWDGCHAVDTAAPTQSLASPSVASATGGSHFVYVPNTWGYMYGPHGASDARPLYRGSDSYLRTGSGMALSPGRSAVPVSAFNKATASPHFSSGTSHASVAKSGGGGISRGGFGSAGRAGGGSVGG